uniref:Uncharacterized protein n=1 Tax=Romanomermis culicivorax TaxID=13658 RepID=A0A915KUW4_ROMCU
MQMPPLTLIPRMRNVQGKEAMDVSRPWMAIAQLQRPASAGNPNYISLLKRDMEIGQPGRDHSGQQSK